MSSFLTRRSKSGNLIPQFQTIDEKQARLAEEEAKDDWKNKSKIEKQRLARIEMRRRKKAQQGFFSLKFWSYEMAIIFSVSCTAIIVLLLLLNHRSARRAGLGHNETWKETFDEVMHMA